MLHFRRSHSTFVAGLGLLLAACGDGSDPVSPAQPNETVVRITGTVTSVADGQPIAGTSVTWWQTILCITNCSGVPLIDTLGSTLAGPAGTYSLQATFTHLASECPAFGDFWRFSASVSGYNTRTKGFVGFPHDVNCTPGLQTLDFELDPLAP